MKSGLKLLTSVIAGLLGVVLLAHPLSVRGQSYPEGQIRRLDVALNDLRDRGDGPAWESGPLGQPGARYIRLRFADIISPPRVRYRIVVRDVDRINLASYGPGEFASRRTFYTEVFFSSQITVAVEKARREDPVGALTGLRFKIDSLIYAIGEEAFRPSEFVYTLTRPPAGLFISKDTAATGPPLIIASIPPDFKGIERWSPQDQKRVGSSAVAKLYIGNNLDTARVCTGFLISPVALLTNMHCLRESPVYREAAVRGQPGCSDIMMQFDFALSTQQSVHRNVGV